MQQVWPVLAPLLFICVGVMRGVMAYNYDGATAYGIYGEAFPAPCVGGECSLEFPGYGASQPGEYYSIDEVMKREIESTVMPVPPVIDLSVLVLSDRNANPRLCIVKTGSPELDVLEQVAGPVTSAQMFLFEKHCSRTTYLNMTQRYNISMTHESNQNDPMGLSTTVDGTFGGGELFYADHTQYTLDTFTTAWEPYNQLYKAARQRSILFAPAYVRTLYFFSATGPLRGGTIEVVDDL